MILGIDPGATTGWCVYDPTRRRVMSCGQFTEHHTDFSAYHGSVTDVVLERPKGQGPTLPALVECGITFGRLMQWASSKWPPTRVHELLRYEVKSLLSAATHGEVNVRTDATAWAALVLLHGEGSGDRARKKDNRPQGAIGQVKSHERAALAVAVAYVLRKDPGAFDA